MRLNKITLILLIFIPIVEEVMPGGIGQSKKEKKQLKQFLMMY